MQGRKRGLALVDEACQTRMVLEKTIGELLLETTDDSDVRVWKP